MQQTVDSTGVRVRGLEGGCSPSPLTRAKPLFFGQKPAAKNEKYIYFFVFIKRKKTEFIRLAR